MKKLLFFMLLAIGAAKQIQAVETSLAVSFHNIYSSGNYEYMSNLPEFGNWSFNNYCYAIKNNFMQVGTSQGTGSFITPALNLNGNATILIKTRKIKDVSEAKFRVSIIGDGTIDNNEIFTVGPNSEYRPSAIYISGCSPSSKIKIEGTEGYFDVMTIKVFSIFDACFYESFDYTYLKNKGEFDLSGNAISDSCDNKNSTLNNVARGNSCIYLRTINDSYYKTPSISVPSNENYILSFKTAPTTPTNSSSPKITVKCSGAQLSKSNTISLEDLANSRTYTFSNYTSKTWYQFYYVITKISNPIDISLYGQNVYLDDIILTPMPTGLSQSTDNSYFMRIYKNKQMDVQITRSLTPDIWCPLCLPFDVTPEQMVEAVGSCELCTLSSIRDGVFSFSDVDEGITIGAGTPFLVKVATQVENPTFRNVIISNTAAKTVTFDGAEGYKLIGTYSPVTLNTDGTHLFLSTDGNLYRPGNEPGYNRLGGLRAYFEIPPSAATSTRVNIGDDANAITTLTAKTVNGTVTYDLQGRRMKQGQLRQGLYISNGRKVLVR